MEKIIGLFHQCSLLLKAIKHLDVCKAKGMLIVPKWMSASFWPMIFSRGMIYHLYVKDVIEFKNTVGIYTKGANRNSIFGTEPFITPVIAVVLHAS